MPTRLLNNSVEQSLSLPAPWQGSVPPGGSAILREEVADVGQYLSGASSLAKHPIVLSQIDATMVRESDYAPYDPVVLITYADSPYTLAPTQRVALVDSTNGPVTVKYPPTSVALHPAHEVLFLDWKRQFGTNNLTIDGNGRNINAAATLVVSTTGQATLIAKADTTYQVVSANSTAAPFNPAAPGAIGGTTPAAGTFTVLTANTSVSSPIHIFTAVAAPAAVAATTQAYRDTALGDNVSYRGGGGTRLEDVWEDNSVGHTGRIRRRLVAITLTDGSTYDITGLGLGGHLTVTAAAGTSSVSGSCSFGANGATELNGLTFTNFDTADTAAKLCAFASGGAVRIRNRLGSPQTILVDLTILMAV